MYNELLKQTNIASMKFKPHILALNGHLQGLAYIISEMFLQKFAPVRFTREILELQDGG